MLNSIKEGHFIMANKKQNSLNITQEDKSKSEKWKAFDRVIAIITLISTFIFSISSVNLAIQANKLSQRNQNLKYEIDINSNLNAIALDDNPDSVFHTLGSIILKNKKSSSSGEYSDLFLATVVDNKANLAYVNKSISQPQTEMFNDWSILHTESLSKDTIKLLVSFGLEDSKWSIFNNKVHAFHILFKAYNGSYQLYTLVCTCSPENVYSDYYVSKKINIHLLDDATIYNYDELNKIVMELNDYNTLADGEKYTIETVLESLQLERKAIYKEIKE